MTEISEEFRKFVKEHFQPLRVRDAGNIRIGRLTNRWVQERKKSRRFSHLTSEKLDEIVKDYSLKCFTFDDGFTYIVNPEVERDIMVEFYEKKELLEAAAGRELLDTEVPVTAHDLTGVCRISGPAIFALTGDTPEGLEMTPDSAVDFISADQIEEAVEKEIVSLHIDEGFVAVVCADEDFDDADAYTLILDRPLPGMEIPLAELDPKQRTAITGAYRDDVHESSHDFEHTVTRLEG